MEREDYILRMIAQMALVLARVRRMLLEGKDGILRAMRAREADAAGSR